MNTTTEPTAIGVYSDLDQAEKTLTQLRNAGFQSDEIGIIGHVGQEGGSVPTPAETKVPEDNAINGFLRGGFVGAIAGALVILIVPGLAEVSGQGWWFEIVGGALVSALFCGVLLALRSFIFMQPKTRLYASELEKGNFIVTVKNPARKEEAVSLLRQQGLLAESKTNNS